LEREYVRRFSIALGREMELLRFGYAGQPVIAFPTSQGRFFQWEDSGMIGTLATRLAAGRLVIWCLDSVDAESWYAQARSPEERVERHLEYERYVLDEVLPGVPGPPVLAGTSFGAFHAVLLCLRHPERFRGWVALSGVYDNSRWLDGYSSEDTYLTNPLALLPGLTNERYLAPLRAMAPRIVATGSDDPNVQDSVRLAEELRARGVEAELDLWPGWQHDWPCWHRMIDTYL
jgi:esterase/lipase superfamily enzyme